MDISLVGMAMDTFVIYQRIEKPKIHFNIISSQVRNLVYKIKYIF